MLTRKAATQTMEMKLRQALHELKESRDTCKELLREREESEEEIKNIVGRNSLLKTELAQLHSQHMEIVLQRDQLENTIRGFDDQFSTYESALNRIKDLEQELNNANKQISLLTEQQQQYEVDHTQSLFEELMSSPATQSVNPSSTTEHSVSPRPFIQGSKKLKKYIKINKLIKKTSRLIKKNKCFHKNIVLRKEKLSLMDSLEIYSSKLSESRQMYDRDTKELQLNITNLHELLESMQNKYSIAQKEIDEHIKSAAELVELCNYNAERYDSLMNSQINIAPSVHDNIDTEGKNFTQTSQSPCHPSSYTETHQTLHCNYSKFPFKPATSCDSEHIKPVKTIMFSDKLGQGLGLIMKNRYHKEFINICTPGRSFKDIVHSILLHKVDSLTNLIVLCGDSSAVKKNHILQNIDILLKLQADTGCKLVISSFPYASNLSKAQNNRIFELNSYLFNLISCHSDNILYFDINNFINYFTLTPDTMYLANRFRTKIANLLAFNLQDTHEGGKPTSIDIDISSNSTKKKCNKYTNSKNVLPSVNVSCSALN